MARRGRKSNPARADPGRRNKSWSEAEDAYLQDKWGVVSVQGIAKALGRTENAVLNRKNRLGLGAHLDGGTDISYNQLLVELYGHGNGSYAKARLIRHGIPVKEHRVLKNRFKVIDIDEFWKWAEEHKDLLDFSRLQPYALGPEPEWAKLKRKLDIDKRRKTKKNHNAPWTVSEDAKLRRMIEKGTYTYTDIASELRKTEGAVKRRILDLGIEGRPMRKPNKPWTEDEVEKLLRTKEQGYDWIHMSQELGRSALAVRGKYERLQNPEYMKRYNRGKASDYSYVGLRDVTPDQIRENLSLADGSEFQDAPPSRQSHHSRRKEMMQHGAGSVRGMREDLLQESIADKIAHLLQQGMLQGIQK